MYTHIDTYIDMFFFILFIFLYICIHIHMDACFVFIWGIQDSENDLHKDMHSYCNS